MARNYVKKPDVGPTNGNSNGGITEAKIVLLGDTGVGKTSIALRFTQDTFQRSTNPTIGASFLMKNMFENSSFSFFNSLLGLLKIIN